MFAVAKPRVRWWQSGLNQSFIGAVAVAVLSGVILDARGLIPFGQWVRTAGQWSAVAVRWLVQPIRVPLLVLAFMSFALVAVAVRGVLKSLKPPPPAWLEYRQDQFFDIAWTWRYAGNQILESSITPFCPRCQMRLRGDQQGYMTMTTTFICDDCGFRKDIQGSGHDVIDRISRLIEREANRKAALPTP
jgi:hypothetical protein